MTVYAPHKRPTMNIPVEPAVYFTPPLAKVTAGNTYYFECPWDNVRLVYADLTVTTTIATVALVVTITDGSTTGHTITTASDSAVGTQIDGVLVNYIDFDQGDTITITTTANNSAGAAAVRLFFERAY